MSAYTQFVARFLFPVHEYLKGHDSVSVFRRLERSQWYSPDELCEYQRARLQSFIADIAANVPYYQSTLNDKGVAAADFERLDTLQALPFLTKDLIRENRESLYARDAGKLVRMNTGGSTGEPMVFMVGKATH